MVWFNLLGFNGILAAISCLRKLVLSTSKANGVYKRNYSFQMNTILKIDI